MLGCMKHKLESRLPGEITITSDIQMLLLLLKLLQSCSTLCDPIDGSPPGSAIPGILQARTLEWVAIFFSNAWKWKVKVKSLSRVWPSATLWTAALQAPPSMGFSRQEYWSGMPFPSPLSEAATHNLDFQPPTIYPPRCPTSNQSQNVPKWAFHVLS